MACVETSINLDDETFVLHLQLRCAQLLPRARPRQLTLLSESFVPSHSLTFVATESGSGLPVEHQYPPERHRQGTQTHYNAEKD